MPVVDFRNVASIRCNNTDIKEVWQNNQKIWETPYEIIKIPFRQIYSTLNMNTPNNYINSKFYFYLKNDSDRFLIQGTELFQIEYKGNLLNYAKNFGSSYYITTDGNDYSIVQWFVNNGLKISSDGRNINNITDAYLVFRKRK